MPDEGSYQVAPFTGAWIEIEQCCAAATVRQVAPFTGAWIEITTDISPLRIIFVAPFTGAWIEMIAISGAEGCGDVAPFTGAWIEISCRTRAGSGQRSLPSRERGLKYDSYALFDALTGRSLHGSVD